jgi:hypothetical protein
VELVGDAVAVEPGARFLHRVAIFDAKDGDSFRHVACSNRSNFSASGCRITETLFVLGLETT